MESLSINNFDSQFVKENLPSKANLDCLSALFSAFADNTRLKILAALSLKSMCVSDLSLICEINQTTVSHQLKILKRLNLIDYIREGKMITYFIKNDNILQVMNYGVDCL